MCSERLRLTDEVLDAARAIQALSADTMRLSYTEELRQARAKERVAVQALDDHRREHGC